MGTCCLRYERGKVDVDLLVVLCVLVSREGYPYVRSVLRLEELEGYLVRGEYRGSSAQLSAHVGNGGSLGYRKGLYALTAVLDDLADAAFNAHNSQHLQYNVFSRYPGGKLARKVYFNYLGAGDVVSAAAHSYGYVLSACAYRYHADTAARRGVRV